MKKTTWCIVSALAVVVMFVAWQRWNKEGDSVEKPMALRFVVGDRITYSVEFTSKTFVSFLKPSSTTKNNAGENEIKFSGELVVDVIQHDAQESTLALHIGDVRALSITMLGMTAASLKDVPRVLQDRVAKVRMNNSGDVIDVGYTQESSPLFSALMHSLLSESQFHVDVRTRWNQYEHVPMGKLTALYAWEDKPSVEQGTLHKTYAPSAELRVSLGDQIHTIVNNGQSDMTFEKGRLARFDATRKLDAKNAKGEKLLAVEGHVVWQVAGLSQTPKNAVVALLAHALSTKNLAQSITNEESPDERLARQVGGLTPAEMFSGVMLYTGSHRKQEGNVWFRRAVGLLRQQPELASDVEKFIVEHEKMPAHVGMAVDLLANAGTSQSQTALEHVIAHTRENNVMMAASITQHATLIPNPSPHMVDVIAKNMADPNGNVRSASALSVGALSRRLAQNGHGAEAAAHVQSLMSQLNTAQGPQASVMVRALGNAALPECRDVIIAKSIDADVSVRRSVASALRDLQHTDSENILLNLMVDPAPSVQRQALVTLSNYELTTAHFELIHRAIMNDSFATGAYGAVLNLLSDWQLKQPTIVAQILSDWKTRPMPPGNYVSRMRKLHEQVTQNIQP